jgi:hypothetical protein
MDCMAYGVILKHLEVDKITWGGVFFKEGCPPLRGALTAFSAGKRCGEHWIIHKGRNLNGKMY